jgi:L-asparaginase
VSKKLPLICLLIAPGTLPSRAGDRMEMLRYAPAKSGIPRLTGQELVAALPELSRLARIEIEPDNPHEIATPADLHKLALRAEAILQRPDIDGLVLVQGTNSLEETAYFFHLTLHSKKPIVVTGAQRPFTALSTDGPLNLVDAFRVATDKAAGGKGALVVFNNEIHSARDVTKSSTYRVHTFRSRELGPLGFADADRVVFYREPLQRHTAASELRVQEGKAIPRVDVLYVHAGANGDLARAAVDLGAKGLVIAGAGAGSTGDMRDTLAALWREKGIVVVRSARVGEGRVTADDNWQEPGMVAADNLNPQKSALLLGLALTTTGDPDRIQAMFDAY